ncbi:uncharacterized protein [Palaemon carinicauda]|uniref:uncharacterized protein n=1 Tax=Palaemon carinicauda TaxID=392227 RepID=UPI0035B5DEE8
MSKEHWSRQLTLNLIELYRQHPCLWDVRKEVYKDLEARTAAIKEITAHLKQYVANMNEVEVKRKLALLRNQHRKEMRKVSMGKKSGAGSEEQYTPKLWCFNALSFLNSGDTVRSSLSNLDSSKKTSFAELSDHEQYGSGKDKVNKKLASWENTNIES